MVMTRTLNMMFWLEAVNFYNRSLQPEPLQGLFFYGYGNMPISP